jgi:hypothetical protein
MKEQRKRKEPMMKGRIRFVPAAALAAALCWGMFLFFQGEAQARTLTPVEGAVFDTAGSLADNLKAYAGKDIIVHLRSGKTIQGYVKSIGNGLLHVEKLSGRDFYDALIRIEDISAIEAKFRDMK